VSHSLRQNVSIRHRHVFRVFVLQHPMKHRNLIAPVQLAVLILRSNILNAAVYELEFQVRNA